MAPPAGFRYERRSGDEIVIFHGSVRATTLRGRRAAEFLADVQSSDEQEVMARITGNYRRGNERQAADHPRNRGR